MSIKKNILISLFISSFIVMFMLFFIYNQGSAHTSIDLLTINNLTSPPKSSLLAINTDTPVPGGQTDNSDISSIGSSDLSLPIAQSISVTDTFTDTTISAFSPIFAQTLASPFTPSPKIQFLLPFIHKAPGAPPVPLPIETVLFCDTLSQPLSIPDNNSDGVNDFISISDDRLLVDMSVYLDITHQAVGDLVVNLTNQASGLTINLLDRPGNQANNCQENDVIALVDDKAAQSVNDQCAPETPAISGIYLPSQGLSGFSGMNPTGTWQLNISDNGSSNVGSLNNWCMVAKMTNIMPSPTPPPNPGDLPDSAYVAGMTGQPQSYNLDCESRSAVDWAKHYGKTIGELDFFNNLPISNDDPEAGFVGYVDGQWGKIPPDDYGVHAAPIADLLNDYGLTASASKYLRWDDLRAEIASGDPVIVWIIGDYFGNLVNGIPHLYMPSSGNFTIVAPYEHTVVLVGYSPTEVQVLNGSRIISVPLDQFLDSWSVLQFMAVLARP